MKGQLVKSTIPNKKYSPEMYDGVRLISVQEFEEIRQLSQRRNRERLRMLPPNATPMRQQQPVYTDTITSTANTGTGGMIWHAS